MLGLVPLAGLLLLSGELGAYGTVVTEGRVGQAPFVRDQPAGTPQDLEPHGAAAAVVAPILELEDQGHNRQILFNYGPRFLWRRPNPYGTNKTLILQVANLSATADATPRIRLIERASASYGEVDYAALTAILPNQSQLPPVAKIFVASAGTGLRWDAQRLWRFETMFDVESRRTLGDTGLAQMMNSFASFRQTNLSLEASGIGRISRRDDLVLTAAVSDRSLDNNIEVFAVTPEVGWRRRLTWSSELRLAAGVTYARDRGTTPVVITDTSGAVTTPGSLLRPVGNVELNGVLLGRRGVSWRGTLGLTIDYFVDPVLRVAGPRAISVLRSVVLFEPDWTVGLEGGLTTSLRASAPPDPNASADETTLELALPVRHLVSENLIVETGLRWSQRAARLRADNLTFHERQTWIYLAFTATTRRMQRWMAPQIQAADSRDEGAFARPQTTDSSRQSTDNVQQSEIASPQSTDVGP